MTGNMQLILTVILTVIAVVWIMGTLYYKKQNEAMIQMMLSTGEYPYAELFGFSLGIIAKQYAKSRTSDHVVNEIKKFSRLKGKQYAEFYYLSFLSQKVTYTILAIMLVLILAVLGQSMEAILLGLVIVAILPSALDGQIRDAIIAREDGLMTDFPQVLSELTLLVNSGMSLPEAWNYVAYHNEGLFYEEMRITCQEIQSGTPILQAYDEFGKRCDLKDIKRFSASVIQSMTKSDRELTRILSEMASSMWNEKRNMAKRKGDAANSKLLIPTALIFIGILALVMVPMFTSMNFG